ncbi:MAG TPA: metal-dependent transcriptional regulator [Sedimentisphaerales bacterium]|nr:metal-dependent transcriptional regulator [Sedimentisphaerales bacterium]
MSKKRERDEHLEQLWYMKEEGTDSVDVLKTNMDPGYDVDIIDELVSEGLVELTQQGNKITLTKNGQDYAQKLIRAHRLAERLLHDVLGGDYESGACEFEHMVNPELVDSICILLGHPRACPHGMPIPQGQCCRQSSRTAQSSVIPLVELAVGQSARVAYINSKSDQQLHKMDSLCIRPGTVVTLHQRYPTYVIECEGSNIAMDEEIVSNICVWREPQNFQPSETDSPDQTDRSDSRRGKFRHGKEGRS